MKTVAGLLVSVANIRGYKGTGVNHLNLWV